jgi:hypothetical protein
MLASLTPDQLAPDQPIRHLKPIVDAALGDLGLVFAAMLAERGRPSIPPSTRSRRAY